MVNWTLYSLVAPIAVYSDSLLAQTLAASTYPLEIIQLQQWMDRNKNLKDKALADAVAKQPWDPSVQALVEFPDVVQRMAGNIQWTTDLGNAFLAQQSDVMDAVQRMRAKAQGTGNLKTSAQQVVETQTVPSGKQVIKIEQANPDVVYVPSYDPTVMYGPPPAEYPYYPYTYPGYVPGTALAWGAGIALGAAAWGAWGGHWGDCDWNGGNVKINNNYNYNRNNNFNRNVSRQGQGNWQHKTGKQPISLADVAPVAPVVPVVRVALVVSEDPAVSAVRAASVVSESPAEPAARERELVQVEPELERDPVVGLELEHDPVVALEQVHGQVVGLVPLIAQLAVALRTKSVTAAHRPDLVPLLEAEEDLAAVAETTREPAAAEAVIAWEVAE